MLVLCLAQLAINVDLGPHASVTHPIASVLWLLTLLIGVPFLVAVGHEPAPADLVSRGVGGKHLVAGHTGCSHSRMRVR